MRFEYLCPECKAVNIRNTECAQIVCDGCKREFKVKENMFTLNYPTYPYQPYYPDWTWGWDDSTTGPYVVKRITTNT